MQIVIDTKKDSKEEIAEAIRLLEKITQSQVDASALPEGENVLGGIFGADPAPQKVELPKKENEDSDAPISLRELDTY